MQKDFSLCFNIWKPQNSRELMHGCRCCWLTISNSYFMATFMDIYGDAGQTRVQIQNGKGYWALGVLISEGKEKKVWLREKGSCQASSSPT